MKKDLFEIIYEIENKEKKIDLLIIEKVINVDNENNQDIVRKLIFENNNKIYLSLKGYDIKKLRSSFNSLLTNINLIIDTIIQFSIN